MTILQNLQKFAPLSCRRSRSGRSPPPKLSPERAAAFREATVAAARTYPGPLPAAGLLAHLLPHFVGENEQKSDAQYLNGLQYARTRFPMSSDVRSSPLYFFC